MGIAQADPPDMRHGAGLPGRRRRSVGIPGGAFGGRQRPKRGGQVKLDPLRLHTGHFNAAGEQGEKRYRGGKARRFQSRFVGARRAQRHIAQFQLGNQAEC